MGGFTKIMLRDTSEENVRAQNKKLDDLGLRKDIRFYTAQQIEEEWIFYVSCIPTTRKFYYPEHIIPQDISSFDEFKKYWNPAHCGEEFVRPVGMLTFDCYFNRTSKKAMHLIARYLLENGIQIKEVGGSYTTFVERCGYKAKTKQERLKKIK